jgi:hypothetical protein
MGRLLQSHSPGAHLISYVDGGEMPAFVESLHFSGFRSFSFRIGGCDVHRLYAGASAKVVR